MRTKNDIVKRAFERLGVVRVGAEVPGQLNSYGLDALNDLLYEIEEDVTLDFDASSSTAIPEARASSLSDLLRYSPALDQFDTKQAPSERALMFRNAKRRFYGAVVGPSDHLEPTAEDY